MAVSAKLFVTVDICCGINSFAVAVKFEFCTQLADDDGSGGGGGGGENILCEFADCD